MTNYFMSNLAKPYFSIKHVYCYILCFHHIFCCLKYKIHPKYVKKVLHLSFLHTAIIIIQQPSHIIHKSRWSIFIKIFFIYILEHLSINLVVTFQVYILRFLPVTVTVKTKIRNHSPSNIIDCSVIAKT